MEYINSEALDQIEVFRKEYNEIDLATMIEQRNYVYICVSPMCVLKIGYSKAKITTTYSRYRTPYGNSFILLVFGCSYDAVIAETQVHRLLDEERIIKNNELFDTEISRALRICSIISCTEQPYYITSAVCADLRRHMRSPPVSSGSEEGRSKKKNSGESKTSWGVMRVLSGLKDMVIGHELDSDTVMSDSSTEDLRQVEGFIERVLMEKTKSEYILFRTEYSDVSTLYKAYLDYCVDSTGQPREKIAIRVSLHTFRRYMTPFVKKKAVTNTSTGENKTKTKTMYLIANEH